MKNLKCKEKFKKNFALLFAYFLFALVLILMINLTKSQAQTTDKRFWDRHMQIPGKSKPTFKPTTKDPTGIYYTITNDSTNWIFSVALNDWIVDTMKNESLKGEKGDKGDIGLTGPQGPPGKDGTVTGTIILPITFPEKFGAIHANKTFAQMGYTQAMIDAAFPNIGATLNDPVDWGAWQMCINDADVTGKSIFAYGDYYINDRQLIIAKIFGNITINGASCYLNVTGNSGTAVFVRPKPIDNSEANVMIGSFVNFEGIQIGNRQVYVNRVGIDLGPTYNSTYRNIKCYNMNEAIHLRFALNTEVDMCEAQYCIKGWTTDMGDWPGANNSNSQSNHSSFNHCRFNASPTSDYAFGIYACSGWVITNCVIEGFKARVGIDWDAKGSTVVKGLTVDNTHSEVTGGFTDAFIKVRMQGGVTHINNCYGQYGCYLVWGIQSGGTYPFIQVSNNAWWMPNPADGKYFKNEGCNWAINYCDNLLVNAQDAVNKFNNVDPTRPISYCAGPVGQCGGNTVTVTLIPR